MRYLAHVAIERALQEAGLDGAALTAVLELVRALVSMPAPDSRQPSKIVRLPDRDLPAMTAIARQFLRDSLRRTEVVGTVIEDAGWNMMLAIYADAADGGVTSTSSACYASGVPPTTALRHIDRLCRDGLIIKHEDSFDRRRTLLVPTLASMQKMETMIRAFCIERPALSP